MRRRGSRLVEWVLALLAVAATPVAAQEPQGVPTVRSYSKPIERSVPVLPDDALLSRQQAEADRAEAECDAGMAASCTTLGIAYQSGEGRLLVRPVAEVLYRQACDGGDANGCNLLGLLMQSADPLPGDLTAPNAFAKACEGGVLSACEPHADNLARGVFGAPEPKAAEMVRWVACDGGMPTACVALAKQLIAAPRDPGALERGRQLLIATCQQGNVPACHAGLEYWRGLESEPGPQTRQFQKLSCNAGDLDACIVLGRAIFRGEWHDTPNQDRVQAGLAYYERGCQQWQGGCINFEALRNEPLLVRACDAGEREACRDVGLLYAEKDGPREDPARAIVLLGPVCETASDTNETRWICGVVGDLMVSSADSASAPDPGDADRIEYYLFRSCTADGFEACRQLAAVLEQGQIMPANVPRAYALYDIACNAGDREACKVLAERIQTDPAAPLTEDSGGFDYAGLSDGRDEIPEMPEADGPETEEDDRARSCRNHVVEFRGVFYRDRVCKPLMRVIRGTPVKAGTAPWAALVWRPDVIKRPGEDNNITVPANQKVLCGGSVIATGWVLTAAHCLMDQGVAVGANSGHLIRLGVNNPASRREGHEYRILETFQHPDFLGRRRDRALAFDIALIRYDTRAVRSGTLAGELRRITLDSEGVDQRTIADGMEAFVFGWGRTKPGVAGAPTSLLRGRVALRDRNSCSAITGFGGAREDLVLCARETGRQQACNGDSGGPLILSENVMRAPVLIGVVSGGVNCGQNGKPSRYTRIMHPLVQLWLQRVMGPAFPAQAFTGRR
ncbi:hypothetical protein CHX26_04450 [Porphyrobacter sp. HT-58-2]|uniref:trypsin-like serine protease n=1 Tax=Porphyrobacter sp. HT-58-2 TaxID=2023229 RepID=UPI000CDBA797|nr:trypsin-like serine protease [Porphyrobacter sp. HT-58-2]AUX68859.1 hypothetical protein CHX26_04450 [Porphyrobacter sp. HT-58-2]